MDIEVGEYVRTEYGYIFKINEAFKNDIQMQDFSLCNKGKIIKHSKNIIDLIEVGDFVNGFPILEPIYNGNTFCGIDEGYEMFKRSFGQIETLLTKEQYNQNCYRLEKK